MYLADEKKRERPPYKRKERERDIGTERKREGGGGEEGGGRRGGGGGGGEGGTPRLTSDDT